MKILTTEQFEQKLAQIPEETPDEWDLKMLGKTGPEDDTDTEGAPTSKEYSGKISLRVPKELHRKLMESAKENGVSLNQFIVYKLAQ